MKKPTFEEVWNYYMSKNYIKTKEGKKRRLNRGDIIGAALMGLFIIPFLIVSSPYLYLKFRRRLIKKINKRTKY